MAELSFLFLVSVVVKVSCAWAKLLKSCILDEAELFFVKELACELSTWAVSFCGAPQETVRIADITSRMVMAFQCFIIFICVTFLL